MKTRSYLLCVASLSALAWNCACAETITVNVSARVFSVYDPGNLLDGQITPGELFTGRYSYDSSAPGLPDGPSSARYQQYGAMASVRLASGPVVFESDTFPIANIWVIAAPPGVGMDGLIFPYQGNRPLANGAAVDTIYFQFGNQAGTAWDSYALPTFAPDLTRFEQKTIQFFGSGPNSGYEVRLEIESAELVPPAIIEISPGTSQFLAQQQFDAALLLPAGSVIATAHASTNGTPLPLNYPGNCQLAQPNALGRPGILCPSAHAALATAPNLTQVDWTVELTDGTVLTRSVEWRLIP